METEKHSKVLRLHLLRMTMLTQRAVDYAVKAYELGSPEFCRLVRNSEQEWIQLQRRIGDRGRTLLASGRHVDSDSAFGCCTLRIYAALHVTYAAAKEIAHNSALIIEGGWLRESSEIGEIGNFVNSMVRLCAISFFKREAQHAKTVLNRDPNRQWLDLTLHRAQNNRTRRTDSVARFELEIIRCLAQIAEQAYEIAEAITLWLEGKHYLEISQERAA